ncbi:MAG: AHH domain-containing protein, partial [Actinomycetota bacterium]
AARAAQQSARAQNVLSRERVRTTLFGRDVLYKRYLALLKALGKAQNTAAVAGTSIQVIGVSPDLIKERDDLHADLIQAGFPGGLDEFIRYIQDFEATFERETQALAFDVLRKYDYLLIREYARFEGGQTGPTSKAAKLLTSLEKVRGQAQALYDLADEERSQANKAGARHRGVKGEAWEGDPKKAAALRSSATAHDAQADELVATGASALPVIAWQDFPREKLVGRTTVEDVRYEVAWYLATHQAAVRRAETLLAGKPEHVYELDNLLAFSYAAQDIQPGTIYDLIIQNRKQQIQSDKSLREILIGVLTVALAIVSFGGGTVGLLAAGAAFGISAAQAVTALEEYDAKTTLYMAQLLKDEPSAAWAIFAVVGAGLDAAAVVQALKVVVPAGKAFNSSGDLVALSKGLAGLDEQVTAKILKAAEQARVAERELKAAVGDLKSMFTSPGRKLRSVGLPGGELLGNLVAISYYYLKSRALQSFERFVAQLEKEGVILFAKLSAEDQQALRQAFAKALDLSSTRQLTYGQAIFDRLSPRARTAFPAEATDRFAAQGKALGKTDQEIIDTLEAEARRAELLEGVGEQKLVNPQEAGDVRQTPHIQVGDYDPAFGDSGRLAENLTAAGRPNPRAGFPRENFQAHHIIPSNEGPQELRTLLQRLELDINGDFNGVWLPTGKNAPNPTGVMRHDYLTGNQEYFARLRTILLKEPPLKKEQVIEKLRAIAEYLNRGEFPPPKL